MECIKLKTNHLAFSQLKIGEVYVYDDNHEDPYIKIDCNEVFRLRNHSVLKNLSTDHFGKYVRRIDCKVEYSVL